MKKVKGFTIIEVLIVVVIIGLLVAAATINYEKARSKARDTHRKSDLATIAVGLDSYYAENRTYPPITGGLTFNSLSYSHSLLSTPTNPWISGLDVYLNNLPIETGPKAGGDYIGDNPCPNNASVDQVRNYNYFIDNNTTPRGYALLARLEIDNDSEANTAPRTTCGSVTPPIAFGTQTISLTGFAIYAITK